MGIGVDAPDGGGATSGNPQGVDFGISQATVDRGVAAQAAIDAAGSAAPTLLGSSSTAGAAARAEKQATDPRGVGGFLDKVAPTILKGGLSLATGLPISRLKNPFVNEAGDARGKIGPTPGLTGSQDPGISAPSRPPTKTTPVPSVTPGTGIPGDQAERRGIGRTDARSRRTLLTGQRGLSTVANRTRKTLLGL